MEYNNYFICALTYVRANTVEEHFRKITYSIDGKEYSGRQTNEATTLYLIDKLAQDAELFDRFIILVTDECISIPVPVLGNVTTYQYYSDLVKDYLRKKIENSDRLQAIIERDYHNDIHTYLDSVFTPITTSDGMSRAIVDAVFSGNSTHNKLYLDFTGGSRISCLVSLLLVKIMEASDAEVKKIVYGNLFSSPASIVDCTNQYDMLTVVENLAKANGNSHVILKEMKKLGLIDAAEDTQIVKLNHAEIRAEDKLSKSSDAEIASVTKQVNRLVSSKTGMEKAIASKTADRIVQKMNVSGYTKLISEPDRTLIKDFNESIIDIFLGDGILRCEDQKATSLKDKNNAVLNEMKANDFYYCNYEKRTGLVFTLKKWIDYMSKNNSVDPVTVFRNNTNITSKLYSWFDPPYPKKVNLSKSHAFAEYLKKNKVKGNEKDETENFLYFSKLQLLYYNFGFPFICTGFGSDDNVYPAISNHYLDAVKKLMLDLSEQKRKDLNAYRQKLIALTDPAVIEQMIPYYIKGEKWSANKQFFTSDDDRTTFVQTLCQRFEKVRPYRNAISHNLKNDYADPQNQGKIASEIRDWLREYQNRFAT